MQSKTDAALVDQLRALMKLHPSHANTIRQTAVDLLTRTLTEDERTILRTHRGNTMESRAIRCRLFESGLKFCGMCDSIKFADDFHLDGRMRHGRPRSLGGRKAICKSCDKRDKPRARTNMTIFDFDGPTRNQRYRSCMTPEELQASYDRGNAQRKDQRHATST